ncbi:MAG: uracil-DNA glycosylase [Clostridiales Family XIII bacterium]|jgi:uracil-DNA glycosylase|nr:uracil-DNA glycosylase [Clostridiales Family XIII bacterium]
MVNIGNDWDELLSEEFEKPYYKQLRRFLKSEYASGTVYPDMHDIFNALRYTAYKDVRAVILGQDPYHGPGQAHGLCFSVQKGIDKPPSLQNIFKELYSELNGESGFEIPKDGWLVPWAEQGVLLLNTVLTVRAGQANSHKDKGWEQLTDRIIGLIDERTEPTVFLLWGANARAKKSLLKNPQHLVLESPHPSPLSAHNGFFGCGHFKKANDFLSSRNLNPIGWSDLC